MLANSDDWLGCMDYRMSVALWNVCAVWGQLAPNMCTADVLFEVYTPDDYCLRPPELLAFLEIFGLTLVLYEDDPCLPLVLVGQNPLMWIGVDIYQFMYPGGTFEEAPCSQQIFA